MSTNYYVMKNKVSLYQRVIHIGKSSLGHKFLFRGYSGEEESSSQYKSSLSGEMSGSSFLGCGSINDYVEGSSSGSSKASYDDCVLIEYTYDLDYEIEDYMLDTMSVESVILALKGQ